MGKYIHVYSRCIRHASSSSGPQFVTFLAGEARGLNTSAKILLDECLKELRSDTHAAVLSK